MRKTIDRDDPDFIGHGNYGRFSVLLDGKTLKECVEANEESGYADVLKRAGKEKKLVLTPDGTVERERIFGRVKIVDSRPH